MYDKLKQKLDENSIEITTLNIFRKNVKFLSKDLNPLELFDLMGYMELEDNSSVESILIKATNLFYTLTHTYQIVFNKRDFYSKSRIKRKRFLNPKYSPLNKI